MFHTDLYVQVYEDLVRVRNLQTGQACEKRPSEPYVHSRALVGNFKAAQMVLKAAAAEVKGSGLFRSIRILI
jgi:hypothetical protein